MVPGSQTNMVDCICSDLKQNIEKFEGEFVVPKNSYEKSFCDLLGWQCISERYYDAICHGMHVELKKGQNTMWFDMVRYAEIFVGIGTPNTITIFLRWHKAKKRVVEIYVIDTVKIMEFLRMDHTKAQLCILLKKDTTRQLNMQQSMTALDMRKIASRVIYHPKEEATKGRLLETAPSRWKIVPSRATGQRYWFNETTKETAWGNASSEWVLVQSKKTGQPYWFNQRTKTSVWKRDLREDTGPM